MILQSFPQYHDRRPPSARPFLCSSERLNIRKLLKDGFHYISDRAYAFPVDDANLQDAALATDREILRHEVFHVSRLERVEVEDPVDGLFNRIRHDCSEH